MPSPPRSSLLFALNATALTRCQNDLARACGIRACGLLTSLSKNTQRYELRNALRSHRRRGSFAVQRVASGGRERAVARLVADQPDGRITGFQIKEIAVLAASRCRMRSEAPI